jgi:hypothetical protein
MFGGTRTGRQRRLTIVLVVLTCVVLACTPAPRPAASPTASPQSVYVANTDGRSADFKRTPGQAGDLIRVVPYGSLLTTTGKEQQIDGQTWKEVRDSTGITGWVLADFLSTSVPPLPTPTAPSAIAAPTSLLIPTIAVPTPAPSGPRPIDTLVPVGPGRGAPALAPLPPAPATRPATPTPLRPALAIPTLLDPDDDGGPVRCRDGTLDAGSGGGSCAGHGGVAP